MNSPVHFIRAAAVIGTIAALMLSTTAAQASPNSAAPLLGSGSGSDPGQPTERIFLLQPDGTTVEAPPGTDTRAYIGPYVDFWFGYPDESSLEFCKERQMCIWEENHYRGFAVFMGGDLAWCEGFRFENTEWQDHAYSIWNSVTGGPSSIWNRFSDGTYRYTKYGLLQPGYRHDTEFSLIMDAWAFDPANTCTTEYLHLHHVDLWGLKHTGVRHGKVLLAAGLRTSETR